MARSRNSEDGMRWIVMCAALIFAACGMPATTTQGLRLHGDTFYATDLAEVEAIAGIVLRHFDAPATWFDLLPIVFEDGNVCAVSTGQCWAGGVYFTRPHHGIKVNRMHAKCLARTSLVHELMHRIAHMRFGDVDPDHVRAGWWGLNGVETKLENVAAARFCP